MAECKGCVKNVTCVERRFFGGNQKNCKDFQKKTHYTLEEIAQKICDSYKYCTEDCPGFDLCRHDKKGVLVWLKKVVEQ